MSTNYSGASCVTERTHEILLDRNWLAPVSEEILASPS